jgi:hypothetical protein
MSLRTLGTNIHLFGSHTKAAETWLYNRQSTKWKRDRSVSKPGANLRWPGRTLRLADGTLFASGTVASATAATSLSCALPRRRLICYPNRTDAPSVRLGAGSRPAIAASTAPEGPGTEDEEKVLAGRTDANIPEMLTKDGAGG